jgi:hypothetical protein
MATEPLNAWKALHEVSFSRWEKRRNYEWLLSYAIWGALAGFIAVVIFGKDSQFRPPEASWQPAAWLFLILVVHGCYLFFIIDGTLRDLEAQRVIEQAMCQLTDQNEGSTGQKFKDEFLATQLFRGFDDWRTAKWFRDRHGLWGQLALTSLLCVAAWASIQNRPRTQETTGASQVNPGGYFCQGCTFGQPPAASPNEPAPTQPRTRPKR